MSATLRTLQLLKSTTDYYREVAKKCAEAGARMIGIKDMAGLLVPVAAQPLVDAIRCVCDLPIHFHTHATSSASLAVAIEMARAGVDIIYFAVAALANLTSQPSLNACCAAIVGNPRYPKVDYMSLEPYDMFWVKRARCIHHSDLNGPVPLIW